jgi:glutaredoxin
MTTITDDDKKRFRQWGSRLEGAVTLRYATTGHSSDQAFKAFVEQVSQLAPNVQLKKDGEPAVALPAVFIGRQVTYHALPLDRELEPFLSALGDTHVFKERVPPEVRDRLFQLRVPALIKIYITPHCPFCPATVSALLGLTAYSAQIRLTIIDAALFVDAAQLDHIKAAPTVILDNQFRWTGRVDIAEVVTLMLERDPVNLSADALKGMIEDGNAVGVAGMMAERQMIFPAFIELLAHPRWPVRLGAMVAFESLVEIEPELAAQVVEPLKTVFTDADHTVKGDLLYVLGASGNRAVLPFLLQVRDGEIDREVRSAADEAVDTLKNA